jgi:putative membrane protein
MKKYFAITTLAACIALAGCGGNNTDEAATGTDATATTAGGAGGQMGDAATGTAMDPAATGAMGGQSGDAMGTDAMGGQAGAGAMDAANVTEQERAALGAVNAVNELEIAASNQALKNNVSAPVAEYARMMVDEHTANREKTSAMNPQMDAQMATEQKTKGDAVLQKLSGQTGAAFEKAYIEAMVKSHTDALNTLENKLIPAATTPAVTAHLNATRDSVAQHLERAQALQTGNR